MKKIAWFLCIVLFVAGCAKKESVPPPVGEKAMSKAVTIKPEPVPTRRFIGPPVPVKATETPVPVKTPPTTITVVVPK